MALATATPTDARRCAWCCLKSADERGFTFFTNYGSRKGHDLAANPHAALLFHRPGIQVRVEGALRGCPRRSPTPTGLTRPPHRGGARPHRGNPSRSARGGARGGGRCAARRAAAPGRVGRLPARARAVRVLAPPRRPAARETPFRATRRWLGRGTPATVKLLAAARPRCAARRRGAAAPAAAVARRLPGLPGVERLEPAGRRAAGRGRLGAADRARSGSTRRARRLRLGPLRRLAIGIPYVVVHGKTTPKSRVKFDYADESDKGPYPIPAQRADRGRPALGDGDRHALIVDRDTASSTSCTRSARTAPAGPPARARSGTSARTRCGRPAWTSADAAGLPILPGLAR